ncbi:hypothetical protein E5329_26230 [Petralouisia muris]|uniref:Uncharacterized protein n=1 Tax=Petralouisia muris TaxID=3032872 RepID=A0AC61RNU0_9FIRM|nr:hypothetical protein [Petralouisia muris]TGY88011.1 hypothetical protein E5329_26230 [Petralouisia muris]
MNSVRSEFVKASKVLEYFAHNNDKFEQRFSSLLDNMIDFIKKAGIEGKVTVNELSLGYMLLDYFEDIRRLKEFHKIEHINSIKIVAYTSYWFLRRKPIQILEQEKELLYINERFVLAYIMDFMSGDDEVPILLRENDGLKSFSESLFYFLKYRFREASSLEIMLTAFFAGQIYQEKEIDLSGCLAKYV